MTAHKDVSPATPAAGQAQAGEPAPQPDCQATPDGCPGETAGAPEDTGAAVVPTADDGAIGAGTPAGDAGDYWTPERLRKAKPLPTPQISEEDVDKLIGPGAKNR